MMVGPWQPRATGAGTGPGCRACYERDRFIKAYQNGLVDAGIIVPLFPIVLINISLLTSFGTILIIQKI